MNMLNIFKGFAKDESGAVTVDWVVLTAAIVGLGLLVMTTVTNGLDTAATAMTGDIEAAVAAGANLN